MAQMEEDTTVVIYGDGHVGTTKCGGGQSKPVGYQGRGKRAGRGLSAAHRSFACGPEAGSRARGWSSRLGSGK